MKRRPAMRWVCWGALAGCLIARGCRRADVPDRGVQAVQQFVEVARERARAADREGRSVVIGLDEWLFFAPELRHLGRGRFWDTAAAAGGPPSAGDTDPLPAILDFHAQLAARGVELLVVPVPPKAVIYPEKLLASVPLDPQGRPPRLDPHLEAFYTVLRRAGVAVLDLTELLLQARATTSEPLYCRQDTHWSGRGLVIAAAAIAEHVKSRRRDLPDPALLSAARWRRVQITGDLWQLLGEQHRPRETVSLRFVGLPQGDALVPIPPDPTSPVVLLADSHGLVFHAGDDMHARGAGLPDQLALELGFPVDLVAVRGSGATAARINLLRRARRDPNYWATKKLVIWCFGAREFTEGDGWRTLPIAD